MSCTGLIHGNLCLKQCVCTCTSFDKYTHRVLASCTLRQWRLCSVWNSNVSLLFWSQIEKLRLAAEMLPPDESYQKAARLVEQAMMSAPWTLTDAFVAHFRSDSCRSSMPCLPAHLQNLRLVS